MPTRNPAKAVTFVAERCGLQLQSAERLGTGVASEGWLAISSVGEEYVFRLMATPNLRSCSYPIEHQLMAMLLDAGLPVPRPIAYAEEVADFHGYRAWSVTSRLKGRPLALWETPSVWVAESIGRFLTALHAVETRGYGLIAEAGPPAVGLVSRRYEAMMTRWISAPIWPFSTRLTGAAGEWMESTQAESHVRLERLVPDILRAEYDALPRLLHGDLHGEHIYIDGADISVLDFGGAFIGAGAWDFSIFGTFCGWEAMEFACRASACSTSEEFSRTAYLLGVSFGIYRLNVELASPQRDSRAIHELTRSTLRALSRLS
jgi:aminoglycoside phosphotransferase (APT) family kinase protein